MTNENTTNLDLQQRQERAQIFLKAFPKWWETKTELLWTLYVIKSKYPDIKDASNSAIAMPTDDPDVIEAYQQYYRYLELLREITFTCNTIEELQDLWYVIWGDVFRPHFDPEIIDILNIYAHYMELPPHVSGKPHQELKQWVLYLIDKKIQIIKAVYPMSI